MDVQGWFWKKLVKLRFVWIKVCCLLFVVLRLHFTSVVMYSASFWSVSPPSATAAKSPSKGKIILSSMRWTRESVSSCHSHWLRCLARNTLCILTWTQGVILGGWEIYSSGIRCWNTDWSESELPWRVCLFSLTIFSAFLHRRFQISTFFIFVF